MVGLLTDNVLYLDLYTSSNIYRSFRARKQLNSVANVVQKTPLLYLFGLFEGFILLITEGNLSIFLVRLPCKILASIQSGPAHLEL